MYCVPSLKPKLRLTFSGNVTSRPSSPLWCTLPPENAGPSHLIQLKKEGTVMYPLSTSKKPGGELSEEALDTSSTSLQDQHNTTQFEFNHVYMCWCKITWNEPKNLWNVVRSTGPDYHCDIFKNKVQTARNVGQINGHPPVTPRTLVLRFQTQPLLCSPISDVTTIFLCRLIFLTV